VTHDQSEAMSISDRIVVLNKGRIEQIATPSVLYDAPATSFVASFIGAMNILEGVVVERRGPNVLIQAAGLLLVVAPPGDRPVEPGACVTIGFRPEATTLDVAHSGAKGMGLIREVMFRGSMLRVHIELPTRATVIADVPRLGGGRTREELALNPGSAVRISVAEGVARVLAPH